jgi:ABC-type lipoprotein export system ATPase subunit
VLPEALVSVEGHTRLYTTSTEQVGAVHDVTLAMFPGLLVLVQGKSGSVKTTLRNLNGYPPRGAEGGSV